MPQGREILGPPRRIPASPVLLSRVPPRARGWIGGSADEDGAGTGSPARAGMDPERHILRARRPRFPRARGDGPHGGRRVDAGRRVPPRARGWTATRSPFHSPCRGSPARAGMDRWRRDQARGHRRFPRARGDGPVRAEPADSTPRLPRERGDGPPCKGAGGSLGLVAPRARGWSIGAAAGVPIAYGCPARAGMELPVATLGRWANRNSRS